MDDCNPSIDRATTWRVALTTTGVAEVAIPGPASEELLDLHWQAAVDALVGRNPSSLTPLGGAELGCYELVASVPALFLAYIRWAER
jgi:hypothetical protein